MDLRREIEKLSRQLGEQSPAKSDDQELIRKLGNKAFIDAPTAVGQHVDKIKKYAAKLFVSVRGAEGALAMVATLISTDYDKLNSGGRDPNLTKEEKAALVENAVTDDAMLFAALLVYATERTSNDKDLGEDYHPMQEARRLFRLLRGRTYLDHGLKHCGCEHCIEERERLGIPEPDEKE